LEVGSVLPLGLILETKCFSSTVLHCFEEEPTLCWMTGLREVNSTTFQLHVGDSEFECYRTIYKSIGFVPFNGCQLISAPLAPA
jgi:hypothetical protein